MWRRDFWASQTGRRKTREETIVDVWVGHDAGLFSSGSGGVGVKWLDSMYI